MENDLFTSISNGDIKNSLLITTKCILIDSNFEALENIFINVCAYIGSFINIYDISKLIDIYSHTKRIIETDEIAIHDTYVLIAKMCIICDIYNKHSVSKCGTMSLKTLKEKVAPAFAEDMKLSANGIRRFDGVLPPADHEHYAVALRIIAILIRTIKSTDFVAVDDGNSLNDIANRLRHVLDFVLRSKYRFETKFYSQDNDNAWFLWGVFSVLYNEAFLADAFWLYNREFKKTYRQKRLGLLWSMAIAVIYSHKRGISNGWNEKEILVIGKIDEIALKLYNEIRQTIIAENPDRFEKKKKEPMGDGHCGIDFFVNYTPLVRGKEQDSHDSSHASNPSPPPVRLISF